MSYRLTSHQLSQCLRSISHMCFTGITASQVPQLLNVAVNRLVITLHPLGIKTDAATNNRVNQQMRLKGNTQEEAATEGRDKQRLVRSQQGQDKTKNVHPDSSGSKKRKGKRLQSKLETGFRHFGTNGVSAQPAHTFVLSCTGRVSGSSRGGS